MQVGGKCRKWMDGQRAQADGRVMILELDLQYTKQSYMKNFSSVKESRRKVRNNYVFPVF